MSENAVCKVTILATIPTWMGSSTLWCVVVCAEVSKVSYNTLSILCVSVNRCSFVLYNVKETRKTIYIPQR